MPPPVCLLICHNSLKCLEGKLHFNAPIGDPSSRLHFLLKCSLFLACLRGKAKAVLIFWDTTMTSKGTLNSMSTLECCNFTYFFKGEFE